MGAIFIGFYRAVRPKLGPNLKISFLRKNSVSVEKYQLGHDLQLFKMRFRS